MWQVTQNTEHSYLRGCNHKRIRAQDYHPPSLLLSSPLSSPLPPPGRDILLKLAGDNKYKQTQLSYPVFTALQHFTTSHLGSTTMYCEWLVPQCTVWWLYGKLWHTVWPARLRRDTHALTWRSCCLSSGLMWLNSSLSTNWIAEGEIKIHSFTSEKWNTSADSLPSDHVQQSCT